MTTLVRPEERTDGSRPQDHRTPEPSRFAAWRSTWTVALRMARRDLRRHRGRSALVVVMVALPTLLLALVVTVAATSDVDGLERIPSTMGSGQALVDWPEGGRVMQGADPWSGSSGTAEGGREIPGFDRERTAFDNADAISRLVGAPVTPVVNFSGRITLGERRISVEGVALDGRTDVGERLRLESGRWPQTSAEALVTAAATSRGVPDSGRITVSVNGTEQAYDIVGTAGTFGTFGNEGLVVPVPPAGLTQASGGWIVRGADPVTWDEVTTLNEYGLRVTSAAVLRDPPSIERLAPELQEMARGDASQMGLLVGLGAAMLLVTTALLVGPAFAVSAARQRRTLALAASNGASTPVLRRTVLAQAIVLGTFSALVGTALGVLAATGVAAWTSRGGGFGLGGPLDVRWGLLVGITCCAVASTLAAALVPARRLGRLDIVGVMRGQSVSARPSRVVLAAGVLLTAVGAVAVLGSTGVAGLQSLPTMVGLDMGGEVAVTVGAVVLIIGTLLLVPVILAVVGRLGSRLPTSLRMAARDLARHRSRSAPSVAAVLAAVASLSFGLTGLASDTEQARRQYVPVTLPGEAVVHVWYGDAIDAETVRAATPGLVVTPNLAFDTQDPTMASESVMPTEPYRVEFVNVLPKGCTPERTVMDLAWEPTSQAEADAGPPCMVAGTTANGSGLVLLVPTDEIVRRLGLGADEARALRGGAVVARGLPATAVTDGRVTLARGSYEVDPRATDVGDPRVEVADRRDVPVISLPGGAATSGPMLDAPLLVPSDGPVATSWPTRPWSLTLRDPSGAPVTEATAERLAQTLGDEVNISVERGFQRDDALVVAILLGTFALLILVITLTSTALTLAEQQGDQATLAALGATRGTRRVMAAAQAFLLAGVGCVLGVAVGLVPGIAIARPLTTNGWTSEGVPVGQESILVIPWEQLATVGVLVPLLAAAIAAAGIRRAPQVTRRST